MHVYSGREIQSLDTATYILLRDAGIRTYRDTKQHNAALCQQCDQLFILVSATLQTFPGVAFHCIHSQGDRTFVLLSTLTRRILTVPASRRYLFILISA